MVDRKPPVGFPLFWPFTTELFHAAVEIFPGIDRAVVFGAMNLRELLVELAWGVPALLVDRVARPSRRPGLSGWLVARFVLTRSASSPNATIPRRYSYAWAIPWMPIATMVAGSRSKPSRTSAPVIPPSQTPNCPRAGIGRLATSSVAVTPRIRSQKSGRRPAAPAPARRPVISA